MKVKKFSLTAIVLAAFLLASCSGPLYSLGAAQALTQAPVQAQVSGQAQAQATTAAPIQPSSQLTDYQNTLEQIYQQVSPSVVNVDVYQNQSVIAPQGFFGPFGGFGNGNSNSGSSGNSANPNTPVETGLGSGFVWNDQGYIVTNNHVVSGASKLTVTFSDGTTVDATVVGTDPNADLAVIKVNVPSSQLHPVTMMDSNQIKVGQLAVAIGTPFGLKGTMTVGIISGLQRSLPVGLNNTTNTGPTYSIPDIIQTDASINPGNSGGVLVNDQGQVMGVTAAIASSTNSNSGVGFVIPSAIVEKVVPALISTGHYDHPWLGISGTSLTPDIATADNLPSNQQGVLVVDVTSGGPASKAGIQGGSNQTAVGGNQVPLGGDVITAVNGQPVKRFEDLSSYLFLNTQPGQTVNLTVLRNGQQQNVSVTLGVLPTTNQ
jgi:serine protease Do